MLRNRLYTAINITGLSVGIAAAILIGLFVRDECTYDRFFPGYRDVYLLTETKDMIDRPSLAERWDFSFPDLAAKLSAQFPQIATVARIIPASNPPHIRHGQVEADETGLLWVDPSFFRIMPLKSLAGDLQTALSAPDGVVLTRTAARKYFGRDKPLGELLEVNPAMGSDAAKVSPVFSTPHAMTRDRDNRRLAVEQLSKGRGVRLKPCGLLRVRALRSHIGSRTLSSKRLYFHPPAARRACTADATGTLRLCGSQFDDFPTRVHRWTASDAYWRPTPVTSRRITDVPQRRQDAPRCAGRHCSPGYRLGIIQFRRADDCTSSPTRH